MNTSIFYSGPYFLVKSVHKFKRILCHNISLLVILLFVLFFGICLYLFTSNINKEIQFGEKEHVGLQIHQMLFNLSLAMQQAQKLQYSESSGAVNLDLSIKNIDSLKNEMESIDILKNWNETKKLVINAINEPTSVNINQARDALHQLMNETATQSNLILDPERHSYHIINLMVLIIPNMEEALRSIYEKLSKPIDSQFNLQEKQIIFEKKGELTKWIELYSYSTKILSEKIPETLLNHVQNGINTIHNINTQLNDIMNSPETNSQQQRVLGHVTDSLTTLTTIYNKLAQKLDWDLQQRISQYKLYRLKMLFALAMAMSLSLAIFIYARKINLNQEEVDKASCTNAILSTVADGIITISPEGIIENFNHSAELIFGYQSNEIIGKNIKLLMEEPCHHRDERYWQLLNRAKEFGDQGLNSEVIGRRKDGTLFTIDLNVGIFKTNDKQMLVASVHDITERKEAERMKNEFISIASHELRTPITSIRGSLDLVLGLHETKLPNNVKELLRIAHENSKCLIFLINDILDIDKMASGLMQFNLQKFNLKELTQQAIETNKAYAQKFNTTINLTPIPDDLMIQVDSSRYIQILSNLLSNAAKFSKPNGAIDVFVTSQNDKVRISIKDYGCGISSEFQSRIFGKFSQENSSLTREQRGSGLGLNISKQLVEKMNGIIDFKTKLNVGTIFWIEFPRADSLK